MVFLGALAPGPGRSLPESGGIPDGPIFADDFASGSGKPFPSYGGTLLAQDSLDSLRTNLRRLPGSPELGCAYLILLVVWIRETECPGWGQLAGRTCWTLLVALVRARRDPFRYFKYD